MFSVLSPSARELTELAVSVSGYNLMVTPDPRLDVWSTTRFPRQGEDVCLIRYHPAQAKFFDYLIAHECGHVYRFYSAKSEERLVPAGNLPGLLQAERDVAREHWRLRRSIPKVLLHKFAGSLCSQLARQLTNIPPDCRIEQWIYESFPSVRDVQSDALRELYATSLRCLEPKIRDWTPPSIYRRSNSMNYALVKTMEELLGEPDLTAPYVSQGFSDIGEKLASYLTGPDQGYLGDMRAADAWAKDLSVEGWYRWIRLP